MERDEFLAALAAALDAIDQFNVDFATAYGRAPELSDPMPELPLQSVDSDDFGDALRGALGEEDEREAAGQSPELGDPMPTLPLESVETVEDNLEVV